MGWPMRSGFIVAVAVALALTSPATGPHDIGTPDDISPHTARSPYTLSATALIMGGTNKVWSVPPATPRQIRDAVVSANEAYVAPTGLCTGGTPGCDLVAVYTPEQLRLFTGLTDMTLDESVEQGRIILSACLRGLACTATVSPYADTRQEQFADSSFVVNGISQSAIVSSYEKSRLIQQPLADRRISFVLVANANRPNGGLLERFAGLYVPYLGITFSGATPTNSAKSNPLITVDSAKQYDGWVDFPLNPLNVLASLNAALGSLFLHSDYRDVNLNAQLQGQYQDTTYYLLPTPILPLLMPLAGIPRIGMAMALSLDAPLRVLVEAGYDRTINPGQPTPAQFGYLPDLIELTRNLLVAIPTGWDDAISYIKGDQSARPFRTSPQPVHGVGGPPVYAGAVDPYGPPVALAAPTQVSAGAVSAPGPDAMAEGIRPRPLRPTAAPLRQRVHPGPVQGGVVPAAADQVARRAVLDNSAVLDHQHPVGDLDGGQPVGDDQRGTPRQHRAQGALNQTLAGNVKR